MNRVLLDTDWIIDALDGGEDANRVIENLAHRGLVVSLITYGELFEGAYYAPDPATSIAGLRAFLHGKGIIPLTEGVMERFAILRGSLTKQLRRQIGDMDLLIAATALTYDLTLLSRNLRDFQHVPGLRLYAHEHE